jgi:hypothetical protein
MNTHTIPSVGSPFAIDWNSKDEVINYAKNLGAGQVVFKRPERNNYNITHAERFFAKNSPYQAAWLVYTTE